MHLLLRSLDRFPYAALIFLWTYLNRGSFGTDRWLLITISPYSCYNEYILSFESGGDINADIFSYNA